MVKREPVSVNWQSVFMIIPIFDLYAAYRIEKLRKYLLFIIIFSTVVVISLLILFPIDEQLLDSPQLETDFDEDGGIGWGIELAAIGISIILIRKWSKKWNEQFSENSIGEETE